MNWFRRMMIGRYGTDTLCFGMMGVSLILMLLARITNWRIFSALAFAVLVLCYLRIFSRNTSRRWAENQRFLQWWEIVCVTVGHTGILNAKTANRDCVFQRAGGRF